MTPGFWDSRTYPIIGLAPMDGVTDAAFRYMVATHGRPDLIVTEFTSVEGIRAGALRLLDDFYYSEVERPIVAQLFGSDPDAFFLAAVIVSALGFDGIDINMGCPAKNVTSHGAGAALILDPERAKSIVRAAQAGTKAWAESGTLADFPIPLPIAEEISRRRTSLANPCIELPVSVKTRIGYHEVAIEDWVRHLLEVEPVALTLHGRTLKQLYSGRADWDAIGRAATIIHQTSTRVLGNGDVQSPADGCQRVAEYGVDGVLIGRAAFGNPWLFAEHEADLATRIEAALEHSRFFAARFPPQAFVRMRKHLLDYVKGFEGAKELRQELMRVNSVEEVERILLPRIA